MLPQHDDLEFDADVVSILPPEGTRLPGPVLAWGRQLLANQLIRGDGEAHGAFVLDYGGTRWTALIRQEPWGGHKLIFSESGCVSYMNTGRVNLIDGYTYNGVQDVTPPDYYESGTYDFGTGLKLCPQNRVINVRGNTAAAFSCSQPSDGEILPAFEKPVDDDDIPIDSENFRRKKRIATLFPASMLSGKARLWLQAQYGRRHLEDENTANTPRFTFFPRSPVTTWDDSFFRYDYPNGWNGATTNAVVPEFIYRSPDNVTALGGRAILVGNHDQHCTVLYSDELTGKYFILSFVHNSIVGDYTVSVNPLIGQACFTSFAKYLLGDGIAELTWDERCRAEAFILAATEIGPSAALGTFSADPSGYLSGSWPVFRSSYGGRQTWDGHTVQFLHNGQTGATGTGTRVIEFTLSRDPDTAILTEAARWTVNHSRTLHPGTTTDVAYPTYHLGWIRDAAAASPSLLEIIAVNSSETAWVAAAPAGTTRSIGTGALYFVNGVGLGTNRTECAQLPFPFTPNNYTTNYFSEARVATAPLGGQAFPRVVEACLTSDLTSSGSSAGECHAEPTSPGNVTWSVSDAGSSSWTRQIWDTYVLEGFAAPYIHTETDSSSFSDSAFGVPLCYVGGAFAFSNRECAGAVGEVGDVTGAWVAFDSTIAAGERYSLAGVNLVALYYGFGTFKDSFSRPSPDYQHTGYALTGFV